MKPAFSSRGSSLPSPAFFRMDESQDYSVGVGIEVVAFFFAADFFFATVFIEDSAEGEQSFRRQADHHSGRKPIRRRSEATLALRCCQN
jgi:hypothetical protein